MAVQISGNDITVPRDGTFNRNVSIAGTLTYEDVTNVDSIGLVTARNGIEIGARPGVAASISVDGNMIVSGISTFGGAANFAAISGTTGTFTGDVDIADKIVHTGDTNTAIRFPSADTIQFETSGSARLTIDDNGNLEVPAGAFDLRVGDDTDSNAGTQTISVGSVSSGSGGIGIFANPTNGNSFVQFGDGTSSADQYRGYMNYQHASDSLIFGTAGSERARIDSSGRVIVGHTATDDRDGYNSALQVSGTGGDDSSVSIGRWSNNSSTPAIVLSKSRNGTIGSHTVVQSGDTLGMFQFQGDDGTNYHVGATISAAVDGTPGNDDMPGRLVFSTTADGATSASERYRIHSNGKHSWNNTTLPYGETFHFYNGLEGSCASFYQNSSNDHTNLILRHGRGLSGYNGYQMLFKRNDGTNVGSIISGASSTSFNTSSDYRLKENQITIPNAIATLNKLKPYEFNFKDDPDYKHLGFFAHEVQEVIPNGVAYGEKDEVYTEDSPSESDDYKKGDMRVQSLDYGKLTPLLTAALQEAVTKIEVLETRLNNAGIAT